MASEGHSLMQLQEITGIPKRTLRDWVQRGILPRPAGKGRAVRYTAEHVRLATAIRHIVRRDGVKLSVARARAEPMTAPPLDAIYPRARSEPMTAPPLDAISEGPSITDLRPEQGSSLTSPNYPFAAWEVVSLASGLLLMVDPSRGPVTRRIANEIYRQFATMP